MVPTITTFRPVTSLLWGSPHLQNGELACAFPKANLEQKVHRSCSTMATCRHPPPPQVSPPSLQMTMKSSWSWFLQLSLKKEWHLLTLLNHPICSDSFSGRRTYSQINIQLKAPKRCQELILPFQAWQLYYLKKIFLLQISMLHWVHWSFYIWIRILSFQGG